VVRGAHPGRQDEPRSALISSLLAQNYSVQTAAHARNVVSAVFTHAKKKGDLPATTRRAWAAM